MALLRARATERQKNHLDREGCAYACLAIQVPTNDLFQYQDGELRDPVNEISTSGHWLLRPLFDWSRTGSKPNVPTEHHALYIDAQGKHHLNMTNLMKYVETPGAIILP